MTARRYVLLNPGDMVRHGDEYLSFDNFERDGHAQWIPYTRYSFGGVLHEETIARRPRMSLASWLAFWFKADPNYHEPGTGYQPMPRTDPRPINPPPRKP